jgi:hypothetical protein
MRLKKLPLYLSGVFLVFCGAHAVHADDPAIEDYTAYPMFIQSTVTPNILIILDNSESMNRMAYG